MKPRTKNITPIDIAITAIYLINTLSSLLRVVSSPPELSTNPAIYPITVLSPVNTTIPLPFPYIRFINLLLYKEYQKMPNF